MSDEERKFKNQAYREVLDAFEKFLEGKKLPEDMSDWDILDWEIYALQYLEANWDHSVEEALPDQVPVPQYFEKGSPLWSMFFHASKMFGDYQQGLHYIEERLTFDQFEELSSFIRYVGKHQKTLGHTSFYDVYLEFKKEDTNDQEES